MSSAAIRKQCTTDEYLGFERRSSVKHEFRDGEIVAMPGASLFHNLIAGNLFGEIRQQLKGRPCRVYTNDLRVCVDADGFYTYPDVVAVCGTPRLLDDAQDTLLNPSVLIEVLSPSTEAYDRGAKFARYRRIESLCEYVVVAQDRVWIELFTRDGDDWSSNVLTSLEDELRLGAIGVAVPVREIYAEVPRLS